MKERPEIPIIRREEEIELHPGKIVYVEGTYEQEDVRMVQESPKTLFLGHVVVVLEDGCRVFLYPPGRDEALRSKEEIRQFEHKKVSVLGRIYPTIPQDGTIQIAPCLEDIQSIEMV